MAHKFLVEIYTIAATERQATSPAAGAENDEITMAAQKLRNAEIEYCTAALAVLNREEVTVQNVRQVEALRTLFDKFPGPYILRKVRIQPPPQSSEAEVEEEEALLNEIRAALTDSDFQHIHGNTYWIPGAGAEE
ncbi:uncharacterized protein LOC115747511 [Rhodamnia argentea]|uniref:Uncharacterized protein LOC115747511 n=1 Tax=Rhodamnia argentea TaxID=178133 RepID=A0A8B8PXQ0_9MYRT|nr:uncharacterized protein LOC115747511 [Rhodamnia argentea]